MNDSTPATPSPLSDELLARIRGRAAGYDRDNVFFTEDLAELAEAGYLRALVPARFGGLGLTLQQVAREQILARVLRKVSADYDVILIDCQPSLGILTVNALTASHGVLIPLECEFFALRGVALLIETIDKVRDRLNPAIELDGILATMFDSRTLHSREVLERVVDAFGARVLETVIGRTVKFPDASVAGVPITDFAPEHPAAKAYMQVARELIVRGAVA